MGNPVDRSFQPSDSEVNGTKEKRQKKHDRLSDEIGIDPCCDYPDEFYEEYIAKFQKNTKKRCFFRFVKRSFDIISSFIGLALLLPIFLIIAIAIKIDSRGPVFFKQKRVGRHGRLFNCYKFRSMSTEAPKNRATSLLGNPEQYVTRVGRFLRKFSLDELPQLYCCFRGTMSLIGPRPLIPEEKGCNSMRERLGVFAMRPGISGYAQVNGRDDVYYKNKAIMDAIYVKNASLSLDLKLIFKTVAIVVTRRGNAYKKSKMKNKKEP
ncbi:MAG: sugar transferase [Clostridia bacterium]|nr:sugar transferase [Clostridia bacterium]